MKLNKLFYALFLLVAVVATSCSNNDEEKMNTLTSATVSFKSNTVEVKEGKGLFTIPVDVNGDMNGYILVTFNVKETGSTPAKEDVNYIVTSKTIRISSEFKTAAIEIETVDDDVLNENRTFLVEIADVQGGTKGQTVGCQVTLKDNESAFYDKVQGAWKFNTSKGTYNVKIIGVDEGEKGYEEVLWMTGFYGYDWTEMVLYYDYDHAANKITLSIPYGQTFATEVNFGLGGVNDVLLAAQVGSDLAFPDDPEVGVVDAECKTVKFDPATKWAGAIFNQGGTKFTGYVWFSGMNGLGMTR